MSKYNVRGCHPPQSFTKTLIKRSAALHIAANQVNVATSSGRKARQTFASLSKAEGQPTALVISNSRLSEKMALASFSPEPKPHVLLLPRNETIMNSA